MIFRIMFILLLYSHTNAQTFNAAPFLGMGNTGLAQGSLYSLTNNPSGIALLERPEIGVAYQPHYLTSEIKSQALFAALPFPSSHAIGFGANNHGIAGMASMLTLRGVYAKNFGKQFSTGISANYHRSYIQGYESDQVFSLDLGFQYALGDDVVLAALARNVSKAMFRDDIMQYIAREIAAGLHYTLSPHIQIATDVYYGFYEGMNYRGGLSYQIDPRVIIRAGAASGPIQYFGGFGLVLQQLAVDVASGFHPRLGVSPQLAIRYGF